MLADDPVAADATCARLMGFHPERVRHIHEGSRFLGNASLTSSTKLEKPLLPRRAFRRWFQNFDISGPVTSCLLGCSGRPIRRSCCEYSTFGGLRSTFRMTNPIGTTRISVSSSWSSFSLASFCVFSCDFIFSLDPSSVIQVFLLQFLLIASLLLALYLVLKLRHHRPVLTSTGLDLAAPGSMRCCSDRGNR